MSVAANLLASNTLLNRRYRVRKVLGSGGQGAVYLAEDLVLPGRQVAVKENFDTSPQARQAFLTEARILAILRHDHLPEVTDFFTEPGGRQYMVMEFIEGEDLDKRVHRRGALPEDEALKLMEQVFDAVDYLHRCQPPVIHRDIKPKNIIVRKDGKVFLVDFGIAKLGQRGDRTAAWARGMGSPGYAPPEQYSSAGLTDQRSDIYSLGATLYFLLTGTSPPEASDIASGSRKLQAPRSLNPKLSPHVEQTILKAMELDQSRRFSSVAQLRQALKAAISHQPPATSQPKLTKPGTLATRLITVLKGHTADVTCLAFHPSRRQLAGGGGDGSIIFWDVASGHQLMLLKGHSGQVNCLAFSPDGKTLVSGSADNALIVWQPDTGKAMLSLQEHSADVLCVAFSPDGKYFASGSGDNTIMLWEAGGWLVKKLEGVGGAVVALAFSPDGERIASSIGDETIDLWLLPNGERERKLKPGGWLARLLGEPIGEITCLAFHPDGRRLASGTTNRAVLLWDVQGGRAASTFEGHAGHVLSVAFNPNGLYLASGSSDNSAIIWDVNSGRALRTLRGHTAAVNSVAFSADGRFLASGSSDGTVRLWEMAIIF